MLDNLLIMSSQLQLNSLQRSDRIYSTNINKHCFEWVYFINNIKYF